MVALAATSDELRKYPMEIRKLTPYLGPQCFPHLDVRSVDCRLRANEKPKKGVEDDDDELSKEERSVGSGSVAAVTEEKCWLRCKMCQKWRCVCRVRKCGGVARDELFQCSGDRLGLGILDCWSRGAVRRSGVTV